MNRMLDAGFYNMDCMDGMTQFPDKFFELAIVSKAVKPFRPALYVGKIQSICFEGGVIMRKHTVNLRYVNTKLNGYFRMALSRLAQLNSLLIVQRAKFIVMGAAQSVNAKVKRCGHVSIKQIPNLASVKAYKSKYVNLITAIPLSIVTSVALDVKDICLALLGSLRYRARPCSSFHLYAQKALSVIHQNIIRKPLFTRESHKTLQDKVGTNHIFTRFSHLELVANSHNITSHILYNTYVGMSIARCKAVIA
jgi:hypothetical protein